MFDNLMQLETRTVAQVTKSLNERTKGVWLTASLLFALALCPQAFANSVSYAYDSLNRLTRVDYGNGAVIDYTYDAAGNRLTRVATASSSRSEERRVGTESETM